MRSSRMYRTNRKLIDSYQHHPHLLSPLCFAGSSLSTVHRLSSRLREQSFLLLRNQLLLRCLCPMRWVRTYGECEEGYTGMWGQVESIPPTITFAGSGIWASAFEVQGAG